MICFNCKKKISPTEAKVVIKGSWWCGECAYYHDLGVQNPKVKN